MVFGSRPKPRCMHVEGPWKEWKIETVIPRRICGYFFSVVIQCDCFYPDKGSRLIIRIGIFHSKASLDDSKLREYVQRRGDHQANPPDPKKNIKLGISLSFGVRFLNPAGPWTTHSFQGHGRPLFCDDIGQDSFRVCVYYSRSVPCYETRHNRQHISQFKGKSRHVTYEHVRKDLQIIFPIVEKKRIQLK